MGPEYEIEPEPEPAVRAAILAALAADEPQGPPPLPADEGEDE